MNVEECPRRISGLQGWQSKVRRYMHARRERTFKTTHTLRVVSADFHPTYAWCTFGKGLTIQITLRLTDRPLAVIPAIPFGGGLCILQPLPRDFNHSRKRERKACNHFKLVIENHSVEVAEILRIAGKDFVCFIVGLGTACETGPRASTVV